jgi:hypothetical protein
MKYLFIAMFFLCSCNSKEDNVIGTWKLYSIETGSDEIDKSMNESIRSGSILRIITFTDSTWEDKYYANGDFRERLNWKYVLSSDKKYLMTTNEKGQKRDFKVLKISSDTLRIIRDTELIATFIRMYN